MNIFIPYLHYIGIMILMGALITEHIMIKPGMKKFEIDSLSIVDLVYGISVFIVLASGLLRWFVIDLKGAPFFNTNPLFHIKLTLFVILARLSIFPTIGIQKWKKRAKSDPNFEPSSKDLRKQLIFIRIELLLLALIPLIAVMVSNGVRM